MTEQTEKTGEMSADAEPTLRIIRAPDVVADRVERLFEPASATRVVSARVVDAIEEADLELERASREADRMLEEARREADRLREEARSEGHEEGLAEVVELMAQARKEYSALIEGAEDDMLELAARLAERIVGEALELDPSRMQRIAADVLRHARGKQQITVSVAPSDREALEPATGELSRVVDGVAVHLEADPALDRGSCVIQTETGRIDGRIETQLETLLRAIKGG